MLFLIRPPATAVRPTQTGLALSDAPKIVFRRLLPRLGYQSAIWAAAHRLCRLVWKILHEGLRFIEKGAEVHPREKKKRAQMLTRALRKLGYEVTITPLNQLVPKPAV